MEELSPLVAPSVTTAGWAASFFSSAAGAAVTANAEAKMTKAVVTEIFILMDLRLIVL
jgi:hypothetical protein